MKMSLCLERQSPGVNRCLVPREMTRLGDDNFFKVIAVFPGVQGDVALSHGKEEDFLSYEVAELMLTLVHQNDFDNPMRES
jgi:hypothetical protein